MTDEGFRLRDLREPSALWRADSWLARRSTLWEGERPLGTLRIEGLLGRSARLQCGAGAWRFRAEGLWGRRRARQESAVGTELVYTPRAFSPGLLRMPRGVELRWRHLSLWSGIWAWCRGDEEVIRFERRSRFPRASHAVTWAPEAREWEELEALVGLGWWMILDRRRRSARHG